MTECERSDRIARDGRAADENHIRECRACRDASLVHVFFMRLARADDLSPALPDPKMLVLKADLLRRQLALSSEGKKAQLAGVGIWLSIAISWIVVLTWKLEEVRRYLQGMEVFATLSGAAISTAILATAIGALMAFTVFAVAVHSVLAEL